MSTGTATLTDTATGLAASLSATFTVGPAAPLLPMVTTGWNIHLLFLNDPVGARKWFDRPESFSRGSDPKNSPVLDGFATTPALAYTSYAQLQADLASGAITFPYQWLYYDTEDWSATPQNEIDDPWTYMGLFGQLAHAHGYKVAISPAKDLGNDPTSKNPKQPGENLDGWYLRTKIAAAAAVHADLYVVQGQTDTTNLGAYDTLFNGAKQQAQAVNSSISVFCHVSTHYGTAAQMAAAVKSVVSSGCYVHSDSASIPQVSAFLAGL